MPEVQNDLPELQECDGALLRGVKVNAYEMLGRSDKATKLANYLYPRLLASVIPISELEDAPHEWWKQAAKDAGLKHAPGRDGETKRAVIQMLYDRQKAEREANAKND